MSDEARGRADAARRIRCQIPHRAGLHDAEFFHAAAEGGDGEAEDFGGAAAAPDHAFGAAEDFLDVRALGVGEGEECGRGRGGAAAVAVRGGGDFQLGEGRL